MKHTIAAHNPDKWFAVPANNGGCGPAWQWGDEILIGFTAGEARFDQLGHQVRKDSPHLSYLARSENSGFIVMIKAITGLGISFYIAFYAS